MTYLRNFLFLSDSEQFEELSFVHFLDVPKKLPPMAQLSKIKREKKNKIPYLVPNKVLER